MSGFLAGNTDWEVERYELSEAPAYRFALNRRELLVALGAGLVVLLLAGKSSAQESGGARGGRRGSGESTPQEIEAWLHVGENGSISVYTGKVEVGQNIRTSLAQAVAEELRVPVSAIALTMGDTDRVPYDRGTFGSRSTPDMGTQLRKVSAATREALIDRAADEWKVDHASLIAKDGKLLHSETKREISYGQLTRGKNLLATVSGDIPLTPAEKWTVAGTSVPKVDARAVVTGTRRYTSDLKRPGMIYGKVLRPSAFNAKLVSLDASAAEAMSGVTVVHDGDFVGVTAPDDATANKALKSLIAEWKADPQPSYSDIFDYLRKNSEDSKALQPVTPPPTLSAKTASGHRLQSSYSVAYIAHVPMEPRAAIAEWQDGKLTVWTGTQRPFGVKSELAEAFSIPEDRIRVLMPDTGSGYGGKHTGEAALEAARLAKATGKPVRRGWSREEEFTWAYFRPAGVIDIASEMTDDGRITAWEFHNYNSGGSGIGTPYDVPNPKIEFHATKYPLRQGSYRGLAATANHFARESHMDELARAVEMDPLAFRLKNLKDDRFRAVLQAAAQQFGWGKGKPPKDHGVGIAGGMEKGGYVATCAEVFVNPKSGEVKVIRAVTAFECGAIVNPEHLKNQVEGGVMMGIGGALFEAVEFENGKILNARLLKYRVPRFADLPKLETVLVNRKDLPSAGAGETPIVGIAPAIGNAICDATGIRLRSLPMAPNGVKPLDTP